MKYQDALDYIESCGRYGSVPGLDSIRELMARLGNPQETLRFIHIAGTNGKGSVLAFLSSVLTEAGYKTGRYLSPTLFEYRERFQIDGKVISKPELGKLMGRVKEACERMTEEGFDHPTPFEIDTALSFLFFMERKCDIVALETGLGGLEDATNIIPPPVLTVLTSISLDHMAVLGESLAQIAYQKAGIIKSGSRVVSVRQPSGAMAVIEEKCRQTGCPLIVSEPEKAKAVRYGLEKQSFSYAGYRKLEIALSGAYQIENCVLAVDALRELSAAGFQVPEDKLRKGLSAASWPGRFQVIGKRPLFVIDGAHNEAAAAGLVRSIRFYFTNRRIIYIIGMLKDKEYDKVLRETCPYADAILTVEAQKNPRGMPAVLPIELARAARAYHENVTAADSLEEAVELALLMAGKEDVILAFGSLSFMGNLTHIVENRMAIRRDTHGR